MDEAVYAARERMNAVTRAALGGADSGMVEDAFAAVAITTGVPREDLVGWARSRVADTLDALHRDGIEEIDLHVVLAGIATQSFLVGWLVRDEQEKRG